MKNKRKLRLAALLAVLLLLFPAFAVEDDITDESDTATTQTEETDQTAQLGGTDSIDPSADKPRVFDYEEVLTQTQIDTLEEKTRAIAEKYSIGVGIITIDDYTPYGDGAYDAAEQLYNELDLGASEDGDGVALLISLDDRDMRTVRKPKRFSAMRFSRIWSSISWIISETTTGTAAFRTSFPAVSGICSMSPKAAKPVCRCIMRSRFRTVRRKTQRTIRFRSAVHSACRCSFRAWRR